MEPRHSERIAAVILAAGTASRMGSNKLLLKLDSEPLVRRVTRTAAAAGLAPILVVVGHEAERVRVALADQNWVQVLNPRYPLGINTSLGAGIVAVPAEVDAAVILLGDMPFVTESMLRELAQQYRETGAPLVASRYGAVLAPPTLYSRSLFAELTGTEGEGRGREVVGRHLAEAAIVDWPFAALADVDVASDLAHAQKRLGAISNDDEESGR